MRTCQRATRSLRGTTSDETLPGRGIRRIRSRQRVTGKVTSRGTNRASVHRVHKLIIFLLLIGAVACSRTGDAPTPTNERPQMALPAGLTRISDPSQVCMINDQFMGRAQIPVVVEGRTYYGCCPACKEKLEKQPASRMALDPVTGEQVDKAQAIIVQDSAGKVMYFAREDTLRRFRS